MPLEQIIQPNYQVIDTLDFAEARQNITTLSKALFALKAFNENDIICHFTITEVFKTPTYLTIQKGVDEHIMIAPTNLQLTNHSCNPNVLFDTDKLQFICIRKINVGDELCFFYPATEWDISQPFECLCNADNCLKTIQGAKYLSKEILSKYRLTSFIQSMIQQYH